MSITTSWIVGLMRENSDELGFIPAPTVEHQYIQQHRVVGQSDERGRLVGYLLHGALVYGRPVSVAQHCIQYERRMRGYGAVAVQTLIQRAEYAGASAIWLRCATDIDALAFWQAQGFVVRAIIPGGAHHRPGRQIARLCMPLALALDMEAA